jgi:antitoxin component YwqK of YwqJK toxin-antitoxin module
MITGGIMIKSLLLSTIFLISCNNDKFKEQKKFYENGRLKSIEKFNKEGKLEGVNSYYLENGILNYTNIYYKGNLVKTQFYYDNGKLKYSSEKKEKDTIYSENHYKNGNIKSKGNLIDNKKIGLWYMYYPNGNLNKEYEYIVIDNQEYVNQIKVYNMKGEIEESESSFFEIILPKNIQIGKNAINLKYYSPKSENSERHLYVIVDNEYEKGVVKKDTFFIKDNEKNRFGIYVYKPGKLKVMGVILDRELYEREVDKNYSELEFKDHKKYFEIDLFVK